MKNKNVKKKFIPIFLLIISFNSIYCQNDDNKKDTVILKGTVIDNEGNPIAGINVIEARINYIAYAEEIANAMLRRQQATAVVAARFKIVEGAVSMVQMALEQLSDKKIVELDEEKKAAMVSNLMVVLVSDKDASPVVNAGTLHS